MESTNNILNELREISPAVAAIEKRNVYTVPDGYFDVLVGDILAGVKNEQGVVAGLQESNSDVPQGYFEGLPGSIMNRIKAVETESVLGEIRTLSPMLYSIQGENIFDVPAGYFETLSDEVINKVQPQRTRVVVMKKRTSAFFKYAVAAAFTGVMALGVFKFTSPVQTDQELPDYVKVGLQVKDVDQELAKVSDDEIMKYLEANGSDVKTALVANSVDENELPSEEDYLLDDQALDKYLNSINIEQTKN